MTRDAKIIGYGLLLCAAALTVCACRALLLAAPAERSIGEAAAQVRIAVGGFAQTGAKTNALLDTANTGTFTVLTNASAAASTLNGAIAGIGRDTHQIVGEITRPCKGPASPDACGLLAQTKKTIIKVGDAVVTTQDQVKASQKVMDSASGALTAAAHDLDGMAGAGTATFTDINAILKRPDVAGPDGLIANANKTAAAGAGIADTTNKVLAKEAKPILNPPHGPAATLKKLEPLGWIGLKVTACVLAGAC